MNQQNSIEGPGGSGYLKEGFEQAAVRVNVLRMAGVQVDTVLLPMLREEVTSPQVAA